ncbi:MAG: hypothetical protein RIS29_305 [Bacteroidota bacterium]
MMYICGNDSRLIKSWEGLEKTNGTFSVNKERKEMN